MIAYYSRKGQNYVNGQIVDLAVGNTEIAARMIQDITGGDLFEICTVKNYPVDYDETTRVAAAEKRSNFRPELVSHVENMDHYDTIILGYPNWWSTFPMAVFTFLEEYDFSGKTILPFCTHEGSGLGKSMGDITRSCPNTIVGKGLAIQGGKVNYAKEAINSWLNSF